MFEMMIAKKINTEDGCIGVEHEEDQAFTHAVQFRPSFMDRLLPVLGQAMINIGLKLKDRPRTRLTTEEVQTPNFLIML